jgi:hypothetical protein
MARGLEMGLPSGVERQKERVLVSFELEVFF